MNPVPTVDDHGCSVYPSDGDGRQFMARPHRIGISPDSTVIERKARLVLSVEDEVIQRDPHVAAAGHDASPAHSSVWGSETGATRAAALDASALASMSASSFPGSPACPRTHAKRTPGLSSDSRYNVRQRSALATGWPLLLRQPLRSHPERQSDTPLTTYSLSQRITPAASIGSTLRASMAARSSIWLLVAHGSDPAKVCGPP